MSTIKVKMFCYYFPANEFNNKYSLLLVIRHYAVKPKLINLSSSSNYFWALITKKISINFITALFFKNELICSICLSHFLPFYHFRIWRYKRHTKMAISTCPWMWHFKTLCVRGKHFNVGVSTCVSPNHEPPQGITLRWPDWPWHN